MGKETLMNIDNTIDELSKRFGKEQVMLQYEGMMQSIKSGYSISSPDSYLRKMVENHCVELADKPEEKQKEIISTFSLIKAMRDSGIEVSESDATRIDVYENALFGEYGLPLEELRELNGNILDYVKSHSRKSGEFCEAFKRAKSLKRLNVDWDKVESEIDELNKQWDEMLKSLCFERKR